MRSCLAAAVALLLVLVTALGQSSSLAHRLARGDVSDTDVMLAAYLGDAEAIAICGSHVLTMTMASDRFEIWMGNLSIHGRGAVIRAHVALVNSSLSFWTEAHPQDDRLESALRDLEAHKAAAPVTRSLREHLGVLEPLWETLTTLAPTKGIEHWRDIYVLERLITGLRYALRLDVDWIGNTTRARPLTDDAARTAVVADLLPFARREGDPIKERAAARRR